MNYRDVLEQCLARQRAGTSIETLLAEHPQHADALRADLEAAAVGRAAAASLPPASESLHPRFRESLQAAQRERAARRPFWAGLKTPALALSGAAAALVAVFLVFGGLFDTQSAEAGTIEGVVVQSADGELTLQTDSGLQTVLYETSVEVNDEAGTPVGLTGVEPGQFVVISGQRRAAAFEARRIQVEAAARLEAWCENHREPCVNLERLLATEEAACTRGLPACDELRGKLNILRSRIEAASRIDMLKQRCESGTTVACREVQQVCAANPQGCEWIRDWLRERRLR